MSRGILSKYVPNDSPGSNFCSINHLIVSLGSTSFSMFAFSNSTDCNRIQISVAARPLLLNIVNNVPTGSGIVSPACDAASLVDNIASKPQLQFLVVPSSRVMPDVCTFAVISASIVDSSCLLNRATLAFLFNTSEDIFATSAAVKLIKTNIYADILPDMTVETFVISDSNPLLAWSSFEDYIIAMQQYCQFTDNTIMFAALNRMCSSSVETPHNRVLSLDAKTNATCFP